MKIIHIVFILILCFSKVAFAHHKKMDCNVETPVEVNFGNIDMMDLDPETVIATISVSCTVDKRSSGKYKICLDTHGNVNNRKMRNSSGDDIIYNLYKDPYYNEIWGKGNKCFTRNYDYDTGFYTESFTIFGKIPVQLPEPPSFYFDNTKIKVQW